MKNPVDCSLYYFALHKKAVVQGLWRMASWNREQRATQKILANNFDDPKWRTSALKNAYALLSKRRFGTWSDPITTFGPLYLTTSYRIQCSFLLTGRSVAGRCERVPQPA